MANTKISALPAGAPAQGADVLPVDRAGTNVSLLGSDIVTLAAATLVPQTTTVNGHALSANVVVSGSDITTGTVPLANGGTGSTTIPALGYLGGIGSVTYDRFYFAEVGSGDISLYTVPAGMRAFIQLTVYNTAGTTTTWIPEVQLLGTGSFYHLQAGISTVTIAQGLSNPGLIFEAGDVFAINTSQSGLNVFGQVALFSNASKLRAVRYTGVAGVWTNGANTVYTATQGVLAAGGLSAVFNSNGAASFTYVNQSGSTSAVHWNIVESGNSVGTTNQVTNTPSVLNNAVAGGTFDFYLKNGDFVSLTTNQTAQQLAWISVWEGV
jgi:hypothetical protein